MRRLAAFAAVTCAAASGPAIAQDREEVALTRIIQKLDLGTLSVMGEALARDPDGITFADYGYSNVEITDGIATLTAPGLIWTWALSMLEQDGGEAICLKVQAPDRRYVQGAWRLAEDTDGYLRGVRFNSEACPNLIVTGTRMQRRQFGIPRPGPYFPPDEPLVPRPGPYRAPDGPLFPRREPPSPPDGLRPLPQFPN